MCADAVHAKGAALRNWGFVDGTVPPICRPQEHQRVVYNGHEDSCRQISVSHSCQWPCGLSFWACGREMTWLLPLVWIWPVTWILKNRLYDSLGNVLCLYGDPANQLRAHLRSPYKGNNLTNDQKCYNQSVSSVIVSVEWVFGDIINFSKSTDFKKFKNGSFSLWENVHSFRLTNAHTCLYGKLNISFFWTTATHIRETFSRIILLIKYVLRLILLWSTKIILVLPDRTN